MDSNEVADELQSHIWDLISKLHNESYDHTSAQIDDMIKVGELAQDLRTARKYRNIQRNVEQNRHRE